MKKVLVRSFGCKVNQYEAQLLRERFLANGYGQGSFEACDLAAVHTCCVTARAEKDCRNFIHRLLKEGKPVWVTGCLARTGGEPLRRISPRVTVFEEMSALESLLPVPVDGIRGFEGHTRAFVKIEDGCENRCSYCIVPLARGPVKSRSAKDVVTEIEELSRREYREIVLTGVDLGAYGRDTGEDLGALLTRVASVPGIERVRLSSIEWIYLTDRLMDVLASLRAFCACLHVSVQSGSDRILAAMGRRYRARDFEEILGRAREKIPGVLFTTDVMVGFPGEKESDLEETCRLVERVGFLKVHVFPYSARPGTAAARFSGQVPRCAARERARTVTRLAEKVSLEVKRRFSGTIQEVLFETREGIFWKGYSRNYLPVRMSSAQDIRNRTQSVRITGISGQGILEAVPV